MPGEIFYLFFYRFVTKKKQADSLFYTKLISGIKVIIPNPNEWSFLYLKVKQLSSAA